MTLVFAVIGALWGATLGIILSIIPVPGFENMPMTVQERLSYEQLKSIFGPFMGNFSRISALQRVLLVITAALVIYELNAHAWTRKTFATWTGRLKLLLLLLLNCAGLWVIIYSPPAVETLDVWIRLIAVFTVIWIFTSEAGLAGDFTSWKPQHENMSRRLLLTLILGVLAGSAMWGCYYLASWIEFKLFAYLHGTRTGGEISVGSTLSLFFLLAVWMSLLFSVFFGVLKVFTPSLIDLKARLRLAVLPLLILCVSLASFEYFYLGTGKDFDLNTNGLADAAGLQKEGPGYSVITLRADADKLPVRTELQDKVIPLDYLGFSNIPASEHNLKRIQEYQREHGDRTVYKNTIKELLPDMLFLLWRPKDARQAYLKSVDDSILSRQQIFSRLNDGVPKSEAIEYLDRFTDEKQWSLGKTYTLSLALQYADYGYFDKAEYWKEKAISLGADASKPDWRVTTPFMKGIIHGSIVADGIGMDGGRLGLVWLNKHYDQYSIDKFDFYEDHYIVEACKLAADGSFRFDNIYEGGYYLALRVPDESLPSGSDSELKILNSPGIILINASSPSADLGTIVIQAR